jgi:hypothetical protein
MDGPRTLPETAHVSLFQMWSTLGNNRAPDNALTCTRRCGGQLVPVEPLDFPGLEDCDFTRLPYPVALTASRLATDHPDK